MSRRWEKFHEVPFLPLSGYLVLTILIAEGEVG